MGRTITVESNKKRLEEIEAEKAARRQSGTTYRDKVNEARQEAGDTNYAGIRSNTSGASSSTSSTSGTSSKKYSTAKVGNNSSRNSSSTSTSSSTTKVGNNSSKTSSGTTYRDKVRAARERSGAAPATSSTSTKRYTPVFERITGNNSSASASSSTLGSSQYDFTKDLSEWSKKVRATDGSDWASLKSDADRMTEYLKENGSKMNSAVASQAKSILNAGSTILETIRKKKSGWASQYNTALGQTANDRYTVNTGSSSNNNSDTYVPTSSGTLKKTNTTTQGPALNRYGNAEYTNNLEAEEKGKARNYAQEASDYGAAQDYAEKLSAYDDIPKQADYEAKSQYDPTIRDTEYNTIGSLVGVMTDTEKGTFNYLWKTEGKDSAMKYYETIRTNGGLDTEYKTIEQRQMEKAKEEQQQFANDNPVLASAASVFFAPVKGLSALGQAADMVTTGRVNPNAWYNYFSQVPSTMREQVHSNISEDSSFWGQVYGTGMSVADNAFNLLLTGGLGKLVSGLKAASAAPTLAQKIGQSAKALAKTFTDEASLSIMASGVMADVTNKNKEAGLDDTRSFVMGTVSGIIEYITEKLSLDVLLNPDVLSKGFIKATLINMLTEGSEEVGSDLMNWFADAVYDGVTTQTQSEWKRDIELYKSENPDATDSKAFGEVFGNKMLELGLDFVGGAVAGGVLGAGQSAINAKSINAVKNATNTIANTEDAAERSEMVDALIEEGLASAPETEAYQNAEILKEKVESGQEITKADIRMQVAENERAIAEENVVKEEAAQDAVTQAQDILGLSSDEREDFYVAYRNNEDTIDNPVTFAKDFNTYYRAGQQGKDIKSISTETGLSEASAQVIYNQGRMNTLKTGKVYDVNGRQIDSTKVNFKTNPENPSVLLGGIKNSTSATAVAKRIGKKSMDIIDTFGKATGTRIEFVPTIANSSGISYANGNYGEAVIRIAEDAENPLAAVFGHESGHRMKELAPDAFSTFAKEVIAFKGANVINAAVASTQQFYESQGMHITPEGATEEVICDFIGEMARDPEVFNRFAEAVSGKEDSQNIFEKLLEAIKKFINELKASKASRKDTAAFEKLADSLENLINESKKAAEEIKERDGISSERSDNSSESNSNSSERNSNSLKGNSFLDIAEGDTDVEIEFKNSLKHAPKIAANAKRFNEDADFISKSHKTGLIPYAVMNTAIEDMEKIAKILMSPEIIKLLPEETEANLSSGHYVEIPTETERTTLFGNQSYGLSAENVTVCIRSLALERLLDGVSEMLGRPLTVDESIKVTQYASQVTDEPTCIYCYVFADRAEEREARGKYIAQRQFVLNSVGNIPKGSKIVTEEILSTNKISKDKKTGEEKQTRNFDLAKAKKLYPDLSSQLETYNKFLGNRQNTPNMQKRYIRWMEHLRDGIPIVNVADVATTQSMARAVEKNPSLADEMNDISTYSKNASHAKTKTTYTAYNNDILRLSQASVDSLNADYGLRFYSYSDFHPAFILENMQMFTDAAARGLKGLAYTKDLDYVRIFARTGANINISCKIIDDAKKGQFDVAQDGMQGADWEHAKRLRDVYTNVGITMIVTNDDQLEWALEQDWIDVVLPYHTVFSTRIDQIFNWRDYKAYQEDKKSDFWSEKKGHKRHISPPDHQNNKKMYLEACKKNELIPRFNTVKREDGELWFGKYESLMEHPKYMNLVNETRQSEGDTKPLQPIFNVGSAKHAIGKMVERGGYDLPFGGSEDVEEELIEEYAGNLVEGTKSIEELFGDLEKKLSIKGANSDYKGDARLTDSNGNPLTAAQAEFFRDSKVVDENGRLKPVYHGTSRADRVGTVFRPDRATSGPMAFFTDNKAIADSYARNKKDTSLAYDPEYSDERNQFRVKYNGKTVSVIDLWNKLPKAKKDSIIDKGKHITLDLDAAEAVPVYDENTRTGLGNFDDYTLKESKGNGLLALFNSWIADGNLFGEESKFVDVLKLAGVEDVEYRDPDISDEKTYEVYLNITNPFDVAVEAAQEFIESLSEYAALKTLDRIKFWQEIDFEFRHKDSVFKRNLINWLENGKQASSDYLWDKNNVSVEAFIERLKDDLKNKTTHAWTSVPDEVTAYLIAKGYDGIKDAGGKNGGLEHTVWIPFYSNQVKSTNNLNPTEDKDIRFSIKGASAETAKAMKQVEFLEKQNTALKERVEEYKSLYKLQSRRTDAESVAKAKNKIPVMGTIVPAEATKIAEKIISDYGAKVKANELGLGLSKLSLLLTKEGGFDAAWPIAVQYAERILDSSKDGDIIGTDKAYPRTARLPSNEIANAGTAYTDYEELQGGELIGTNMAYTEAAQLLGSEIMHRIMDAKKAKPTVADKYGTKLDAERTRSSEALKAQADRMEKLRKEKNARIAEVRKEGSQRLRQAIADEKAERNRRVAALKRHYQEKERKARERRDTRELQERIEKHCKKLNHILLYATDKKHIPESLQLAVTKVLDSINMESAKTYKDGTYTVKDTKRTFAFQELKRIYKQLGSELVIDPAIFGDETTAGLIDQIEAMKDKPIMAMTYEELEVIYQTLRAIEATISTANKMFYGAKWQRVSDIANAFITENSGRKRKANPENVTLATLQRLTGLDMLTPEAYFHQMGAVGQYIFQIMRRAQDKQIGFIAQARGFTHESGVADLDFRKLEKQKIECELGGRKATLSVAQAMDLYCLSMRDQGMQHITTGGIELNGMLYRHIAPDEILRLSAMLTPEQMAACHQMVNFLSTTVAEWGNDAAMEVYNYTKFHEKTYWPIKSSNMDLKSEVGKDNTVTSVSNKGMTIATVPHATTAVIIGSAFDTFNRHVNEMANYAAWLAPMEDINRIRNFVERDSDGAPVVTVKEVINLIHGAGGAAYLQKLMTDLSNASKSEADYTGGFFGNFKAAAVGANIRVIIQQPTAILRALSMISPKYLAIGMKPGRGWKKAVKYAPIAQWKDWGYFDVNTGPRSKSLYFKDSSPLEIIKNLSMWGAGKADSVSWGILWNACEAEVKAKYEDLKPGTEEFYKKVAERFAEIIDHTQVVDGILQRSQIMRSKNALNKLATSFMGEPTKIYNMFISAVKDIQQKKPEATKIAARTFIALVVSGILNAVAQSIVDALRSKDDDPYLEKLLKAFLWDTDETTTANILKSNLIENFNPAGFIPYVKDIVSILEGYELERTDMQAISDMITTAQSFINSLNGKGTYSIYTNSLNMLGSVATAMGIPLSNLKRDVLAVTETAVKASGDQLAKYNLYKFEYNMATNKSKFMDILIDAYQNNKAEYEIIRNDMIKEDKMKTDSTRTKDYIDNKLEPYIKEEERRQAGVTDEEYAAYEATLAEMGVTGTPKKEEVYKALKASGLSESDQEAIWESCGYTDFSEFKTTEMKEAEKAQREKEAAEKKAAEEAAAAAKATAEKEAAAAKVGLSTSQYDSWKTFKDASDADGNGYLKNSEIEDAIRRMGGKYGWTQEQMSSFWLDNLGKSAKTNPFD